jgi:hypothetical protein
MNWFLKKKNWPSLGYSKNVKWHTKHARDSLRQRTRTETDYNLEVKYTKNSKDFSKIYVIFEIRYRHERVNRRTNIFLESTVSLCKSSSWIWIGRPRPVSYTQKSEIKTEPPPRNRNVKSLYLHFFDKTYKTTFEYVLANKYDNFLV